MSRYTLDEVDRQSAALPDDLARLAGPAGECARRLADRLARRDAVVLLGSGDSRHAALAALPAFGAAGLAARVVAASTLVGELSEPAAPDPGVVVAVSASGGNPALVEAVEQARDRGVATVAVTGVLDSPLARAASDTLHLDPGPSQPSPGLRSYQASLLGLLCLARWLPEKQPDRLASLATLDRPDELRRVQLSALAAARDAAEPVAELLAETPVIRVVAAETVLGSAAHLAAKLTEVAGVPAVATELEEWWHVHRFGHQPAHPLVFLVPAGRDQAAAIRFAARTAERRRVLLIGGAAVRAAVPDAVLAVALPDEVPELVRPLVDAVPAGVLAAALARRLGRLPFDCP